MDLGGGVECEARDSIVVCVYVCVHLLIVRFNVCLVLSPIQYKGEGCMECGQMLRETVNKETSQIKLFIQFLPIYSVLSVFKSTHSCFNCLDIFVCVLDRHTHQHNKHTQLFI